MYTRACVCDFPMRLDNKFDCGQWLIVASQQGIVGMPLIIYIHFMSHTHPHSDLTNCYPVIMDFCLFGVSKMPYFIYAAVSHEGSFATIIIASSSSVYWWDSLVTALELKGAHFFYLYFSMEYIGYGFFSTYIFKFQLYKFYIWTRQKYRYYVAFWSKIFLPHAIYVRSFLLHFF